MPDRGTVRGTDYATKRGTHKYRLPQGGPSVHLRSLTTRGNDNGDEWQHATTDPVGKIMRLQAGGGTNLTVIGNAWSSGVTGTASAEQTSEGQFVRYTPAATLNTQSGAYWFNASSLRFDNIYAAGFKCMLDTGALDASRNFVGLVSGDSMASSTPAVSMIAMLYEATVNANWLLRIDNGSGSPTSIDTGIVAATSQVLQWSLSLRDSRIVVVNETTGAIIIDALQSAYANMPAASTNMRGLIRCINKDTKARSIAVSVISLTTK